jgi:hypothetical protein
MQFFAMFLVCPHGKGLSQQAIQILQTINRIYLGQNFITQVYHTVILTDSHNRIIHY